MSIKGEIDSEQWNKINQIFSDWLDHDGKDPHEFLSEACGSDDALRKEVELLIMAYLQSNDFIEAPVFEEAAQVLSDEEDLFEIGQQIGAYKILKELGRGGMGAVYLAERADQQYQKKVAIKLIKRGMDTDQVLRRFRKERQILASFDHPNIARLLEGGSTSNGLPYFVMEYVEGHRIDQYCDQNSLSITDRLKLFRQVCAAVAYAHRNLVIHRDLKPGNILVTTEGLPKLLDFGIAKILEPHADELTTVTGLLAMTPEYASPEQALGTNVTTLSDIYSLGVLLYELLTGHSPYEFKSVSGNEIVRIITETKPQLPSTIVKIFLKDVTPESVSKSREGTPERLHRRLRGDLDNIVLMAMRKEAHRRYQSVDQFSDDIRRHLDGHPVIARKDTFIYRGTKFLKRNKVASAFAILTIASIVIAGMIRWNANQKAKLFQEFGQEVTRMEAIMRYAYLLPLHNIQPEKKLVAERLEQMKQTMRSLGEQAYGPGHYSLGKAYLALHRYEKAYEHLSQAWVKHEYREPDVSNALGLAAAMIYQEKLSEAELLYNKDELLNKRVELEKQFRDPALRYIQRDASISESPEYVKALIAFMEKHYDEALKHAEIAIQKTSWLYEGSLLKGHIYAALANEQRLSGKTDIATDLYQKAETSFLQAARKGQSDPQIYEALCGLKVNFMLMNIVNTGSQPDAVHREGIAYCDKALLADSEHFASYITTARSHIAYGYYQRTHGQTLKNTAEKAITASKIALKIEPDNASAYLMLGNAYSDLADEEIEKEGNPVSLIGLSNASYEIVLKKRPKDSQALSNHGWNFLTKARYEMNSGRDPLKSLEKAKISLTKATEISNNHHYLDNLGTVYFHKARYEIDTGLDATDALNRAIECFKKAIDLNPSYVNGYVSIGHGYLYLADFKIDRSENPLDTLDQAITAYNKALKVDPNHAYALAGLGFATLKKADWQFQHGSDPTNELNVAKNALGKSIQYNKNLLECYSVYAEAELLSAKIAIAKNQNPQESFSKAERIVKHGLKLNSESFENLGTLARLSLLRAEYYDTTNDIFDREIQKGIDAAKRTIAVNPRVAETHITLALLYLMSAQRNSGEIRIELARNSEVSFMNAIKVKKILEKKYAPQLEEAKRLATTATTQKRPN